MLRCMAMPRLAVLGPAGLAFALAGDARTRRSPSSGSATSGPTRRSRSRPRSSPRWSRALPGGGLRGRQRHRPAQAGGARARRRGLRGRARDRRRQHAELHRGRGSRPRTPTPPGCSTRSPSRRPASARSCSAPAARPGRWSGRLREAGAEVSVWNRTPRAAERSRRARRRARFDVTVLASRRLRPDRQRTTVGMRARPANVHPCARPKGAADRCRCDLRTTDRGGPRLRARRDGAARASQERGARVVDGLEVLVRQGAASLRIWTGLEPPIEAMRSAAEPRRSQMASEQATRTPATRSRGPARRRPGSSRQRHPRRRGLTPPAAARRTRGCSSPT